MTMPRSRQVKLQRGSELAHPGAVCAKGGGARRQSVTSHLRMLAEHIGPRAAGTLEAAEARRYIERSIRSLGRLPEVQPFSIVIPRYPQCILVTDAGRVIPSLPILGSAPTPGALGGVPSLWCDGVVSEALVGHQGGFLLCPVAPNSTSVYTRLAWERKAAGVILYHPDVPDLYSEVVASGEARVPCVTVRRADAQWLAQNRPPVRLNVIRTQAKVLCSNILVEVGTAGRPLLVLAHYDTRPGSPGALCNASGVAVLLELLHRLRGSTGPRVLFGFLDGEEMGAAGSRHCRDVLHALGTLEHLRGVIYLSGMGLQNLAVLLPAWDSASPRSTVARQSRLLTMAKRCAVDEKIHVCDEASDSGHSPVPPGVWSCAAIGLAGTPAPVRHTSADLPSIVQPRHLLAVAAALDRLVHLS